MLVLQLPAASDKHIVDITTFTFQRKIKTLHLWDIPLPPKNLGLLVYSSRKMNITEKKYHKVCKNIFVGEKKIEIENYQ